MDVIFLTGAGSEPAQSIARRLVAAGFRVYGFASQFPAQGFNHADFIPVPVDLSDPAALRAELTALLERETTVTGVVLAGHYPVDDTFEATHAEDIPLALNAGVTGPLLLVRAVLPMLVRRRGHVIALTRSVPDGTGAALAAAAAGALQGFVRALFTELRDTGVKAAHLRLENNPGAPDPAARFTHAPQSQVQPDIVADTVETLLRLRENNALTELVLRPQATREEPRLPVSAEPRLRALQVVQLPPRKNFPPPEETIYTPERKRPDYAPPPGEADDFDDDEDDSIDPELSYLLKSNRPRPPAQSEPPPARAPQPPPQNRREPKPRSGALRVHPPTPEAPRPSPQAPSQPKPSPAPSPYPGGWHGPRPPSPRQWERMARRQRQDGAPRPAVSSKTPAAPVPEFVPPPPPEAVAPDVPVFVPPVAREKSETPVAPAPETAAAPAPEKPSAKKRPRRSAAKPAPEKKAAPRRRKTTPGD